MDHSDLVHMDPTEAIRAKFQRGRDRYGPRWQGQHRVLEAHAEILDALAYLTSDDDVRDLQGFEENDFDTLPNSIVKETVRLLLEALHGVRMLVDAVGIEAGTNGTQDGTKEFWGPREIDSDGPEGCG